MKFEQRLQIGDWSMDGHGNSRNFDFRSNSPKSLIVAAHREFADKYKVACHRFDSKPIKDLIVFCSKYEETDYNQRGLQILLSIGFPGIDAECLGANGLSCYDYPIEKMYLEMVKFINPNFEYETLANKNIEVINNTFIGYGTFT